MAAKPGKLDGAEADDASGASASTRGRKESAACADVPAQPRSPFRRKYLAGLGGAGIAAPKSGIPSNTSAPTIAGGAAVGQLLTAAHGAWTESPTSYLYQWFADAVSIGGATASTFTPTGSQLGKVITVGVRAVNAAGTSSRVLSAGTVVVVSAAVWAIAVAVWVYPDRVLASGVPDPPTNPLEEIEAAVWTNATRTLTG